MPDTLQRTVAQAVVKFLGAQYSESDGDEQKLFAGCFGIFGHGNVAGIGQALLQAELEEPETLPYILGRNEQAMVHTAVAYARMKNRLQTYAVSTSVGPGATNMVTGAALATINRLPVLLLPADTFADRSAHRCCKNWNFHSGDVTVNDAFGRSRVLRPDLAPRTTTGGPAVRDASLDGSGRDRHGHPLLPQDVQAEAYDWPADLLTRGSGMSRGRYRSDPCWRRRPRSSNPQSNR
jgi:3D-(3,5/4)-trihydroxycyclohexane-1,2-dione acylhydrolase (decyclizing)